MKKIHILALSAIAAVGSLAVSCQGGGGLQPNSTLKTETDTLSYAFGVQIGENGLVQYLNQIGVIQDTSIFRLSQLERIKEETDPTKKAILEKELPTRLDSLNKANAENTNQLIKGIEESIANDSKSKNAYYMGLQVGSQIKNGAIDNFEKDILAIPGQKANKPAILAGLISYLKKDSILVKGATAMVQTRAVTNMQKVQKEKEEEMKKQFAPQVEAGKKFMEENKAKAGVVTLPSGLQYKVIKEGNGPKPTAQDQVKVFYKGSLLDGNVFETNEGKEAVTLGVGQVIPGWTEALQLMPVGSKWTIYLPSELGYGAQQAGQIPPFTNLVFDIELVDIVK